jgi:type I restriction enzyme S subunit
MNAERLVHYYQQIADAPDAVAQLRRFILDLAVRGKLVPQDPNDEPANGLLQNGIAEKDQVTESRGKNTKISDKQFDEPFSIPKHWVWCNLGTIATLVRGISFPASAKETTGGDNLIPCFRSGNIQSEIIWGDFIYVDRSIIKNDQQFVQEGDILISIANSYELVGKSSIVKTVETVATFGAFLAAIRLQNLLPEYIQYYLSSEYSTRSFRIGSAQTTNIANITFATIREHPVPLPPLAEQKRIVERVDQLMALCDQLEAARANREQLRSQFSAATLARLNQPAEDQAAFRADAGFALQHFATLSATPAQIKALRQTILNLAVRGKLVPQDPNDEPASVLLERIASKNIQKEKLEKKYDKDPLQKKPSSPIPSSWAWTKLGDVIVLISGQHLQPNEYSFSPDEGIPYITGPSDFGENGLCITRYTRVKKTIAKKDQILLTVKGAGVGKTAICDLSEVAISRQLMAMSAIGCDQQFLLLITHNLADNLKGKARSLIPGISREDVLSFEFPLPPLAEQKRIVAKVDQLMALCDQLEASLQQAERVQHQLLQAVLQSALEPVEELEVA